MPGFTYTMRRGDTLWGVARRYRVRGGWRAIWEDDNNEELRGNRPNADALQDGDRVYIPGVEGNRGAARTGRPAAFRVPPPYRIRAEDGSSAPPAVIPVRGTLRLTAVHNRGASGTWSWSTDSTKIRLSDEDTDTVTITARRRVSASLGAEVIRLTFTPDGGRELPSVSAVLSVIKVTFSAFRLQRQGFDSMADSSMVDAVPSGETPHLSVQKDGRTRVQVVVEGGPGGGCLTFTSDDESIATAELSGTPPARFSLAVNGGSTNKGHTNIKARVGGDSGAVVATIVVNVYNRKRYSAMVARIWDSHSAGTQLSRPDFSIPESQRALRGFYKKAVATIDLSDYNTDGGVMDVRFDRSGSGALVLEAGRTSRAERKVKRAVRRRTGTKIVIVKKLAWLYKIGRTANRGDTTITFASFINDTLMGYIGVGNTYRFGAPGNYEAITVTAVNRATKVVTISSALAARHRKRNNEGLWWPLGGLSGNPAFVQEANDNQAKVDEVMGHELGHELLNYKDLGHSGDATVDATLQSCLMYFSNGRTDTQIRFKSLHRYYPVPGGSESQWDMLDRT